MGQDLRSYSGAVLYIDILGFGALTKGQINLDKKDYEYWITDKKHVKNNQFLAANILVKFRKILQDLSHDIQEVKVSQLSDCFFVWSDDIQSVVSYAFKFMHNAIEQGILCRGGMAYGEIIETDRNHDLGRLILGNAVSQAVALEGLAKGARILINQDLPGELFSQSEEFSNKMSQMFEPFTNPLDYVIYDEFKWYLVNDLLYLPDSGLINMTSKQKVMATQQRLMLANKVLFNPIYNWNAKNALGRVHLQATANFLSENYLLGVLHEFEQRYIAEKRSITINDKMNIVVQEKSEYKIKKKPKIYNLDE